MLIVNADDYGLIKETTDKILYCFVQKRINSASAMTFMSDSERAADIALKTQLPVGLHLNLDENYTGSAIPSTLREKQQKIASYLNARKWNQVLYNPLLRNLVDYVFQAQWEEFIKLYHEEPQRLDGHRHMHLCMNMLFSGKIPEGIRIRRNFTFSHGEKNILNRFYRRLIDWWLKSKFLCTDIFYSMNPIDLVKIKQLVELSETSDVEIMVHPGIKNEYTFLMSSEWKNLIC
jgi:chitin disaccharide deacetylase